MRETSDVYTTVLAASESTKSTMNREGRLASKTPPVGSACTVNRTASALNHRGISLAHTVVFLIKKNFFVCLPVCIHGCQERVSDPLMVELQTVVNCLISVLGTKLGSSIIAAGALNH